MSDLNINLSTLQNMTSTQRSDYALNNISPSKDDDINLNQSIFKAYLQSLKEKSDDTTKEMLQTLQNAPITQVGRLFGDLQVNSVEQVSKIFEDLRVKPSDEINSILETMRDKAAEKAEKAEDTDKTGNQVQKYIDRSMEKLSEKNDSLRTDSTEVSESVKKLEKAFERSSETGELDREKAHDAARDFVDRYNTFADTIKNSDNSTVSAKSKLVDEMADAYASRLEKVGITKGEDGRLSLDEKKLDAAGEKDVDRIFGKEDSFAEFIDGQAKQLSSYAQTDLYQRSSAYTDAGNITQVSNISGSYFNMLG